MHKLSNDLSDYIFATEREDKITLEEILNLAGERIFGFLLVILSLPSALPIPAPGYSIPFGILIFLLAIQLISGAKTPWLPAKMLGGSMKIDTARKFLKMGLPWLKRVEAITKPRLTYISLSLPGRVIMGSAIALMAVSMMIPIPGTNTAPAMGIFVTAFGMQEDDGFIVLAGLILCLLAGTVSASIIYAAIWGGSTIIDILKETLGK